MDDEITDAEVADLIELSDNFIELLRGAISATDVDPAKACADDQRRGLERIASTLDAVPFVTMCNLANLDAAMHGGLLDMIELGLLAVGAGPTLDFEDATAFLAEYGTVIEKARMRWLH